ncbi:MAG: DUF6364 family protein [bacterium]|nr:DUF6364 family protein [bacterium]
MNTVISVKIDKQVKESAQSVAKSAGLTLSALINSYLRQVIATRHIEIFIPEEMSPKLEGLIAEVDQDIRNGKISRGFSTADEFLADLKK